MSKEMWEFEEDGEMFSAKCVQGFLPELFSRWSESGTNHVVSIVLFTRVLYEGNDMNVENLQRDPYGRSCQDFYRVLADWETAQNWAPLLTSIKRELLNFQKDIMQLTDSSGSTKIAGTNTHASEGNILEAVNLALNPFDKHYVDRDLSRTGLSIVIVTPGTGIFEVDKTLCRMTNRRMTDNGIGLDLVCLSKPPLHSVPLFQLVSADTPQSKTSPVKQEVSSFPQRNSYLSETSPRSLHKAGHNMSTSESSFSSDLHQNSINTGFSLPSWVDISFWSRPSTARTFTPRCKMYEIQMIGLLEGGRTQLHVPFLKDNVPDSNDQNVPIFNGSDARIISTKTARNLTGDESGNQNSKNSRGLNGNEIGSVGENIVDQYMNEIDILAAKLYRKKEHQLYDENVFKAVDAKPQKIRKEESPALFTTVLGEDQDPASPDVMDSRPMMGNSKSITIPIRKRADPHNNSLARSASHSRGSYSGSESGSPVGSYRRSNRSAKSQSVKSMVAHIAADQSFTNPWNPSKSVMKGDGNVYRWEHINPAQVSHISMETTHGYMKWKSLCTPACLPLTTAYFPDPDQLSKLYMEYTYKVSQEDDKIRQSRSEMQQKAEVFMLELVRQRLAQGFQLIVPNINDLGALSSTGTAGRKKGSMLEKLNDPIPGSRPYFVSLGDHVHKLSYDGVGAVEVKRYIKMFSYSTKPIHYECKIWPKHQKGYEARRVEFAYPPLADYNWSYMDNLISGYQDQMTDALRFWRTRYLVIPMETPPISAGNSPDDTLDDEEERIGGFKKFLELLKKASIDKDNPKNAIQVNFTTFNVSGFVKNEAASIRESGDMPVTNSENLTTASSLLTVAVAMQQPNEVTIKERRWHFQLFDQVFVGEELIDWLVRRFSDITTRESAVAYGNTLLKQGVFEHVLGKHKLLDGLYFYRLKKEYVTDKELNQVRDPSHWFYGKRASRKGEFGTQYDSVLDHQLDISSNSAPASKEYEVTKQVLLNMDPHGKSHRSEIAHLHYGTLQNPRNCYHFQIHWLVCTARLIEEMLYTWARMAEKWGLKIVEAPVDFMCKETAGDSFQSFVNIKLAVDPPICDHLTLETSAKIEIPHQWFEMELLKQFNFVLDVEADDAMPPKSVKYSYLHKRWPNTQFVHRSGLAFIQILPRGEGFMWVYNRVPLNNSTFRSNTPESIADVVKNEFQSFCSDSLLLEEFWHARKAQLMETQTTTNGHIDD